MTVSLKQEYNLGLANWTRFVPESEIRRLLKFSPQYYFAGGKPGNLPINPLKEILGDLSGENDQSVTFPIFNYGSSSGYEPLRQVLADRMIRNESVPLARSDGFSNVTITTGSQQTLYGLLQTIINPNDVIVVPHPTYLGFLGPAAMTQASIISVPCDSDGIIPEAVEVAFQKSQLVFARRPKVLYLQSYSDNPRGTTISRKRKKQLFDLAEEWNVLIIEDAAYKEIRFGDQQKMKLEPIKSFDKENTRVAYLCTTSKEVAVLRIGYSVLPTILQSQFVKLKGYLDLCTPVLTQEIARQYYTHHIDENLPGIIKHYEEQATAMKQAIDTYLPGIRTDPVGGFFIWHELPNESFDTGKILPEMIENEVLYVPGGSFYPLSGFAIADDCTSLQSGLKKTNEMRLSFSASPPQIILDGIKKLSYVLGDKI
ncbi:MAG: aminotransferase-like domain-containing protein [Candidatus Kariarchaeaceae archaeon]|jgi:DNA-binding transcriptional MocR family regulator